MFLPLSLESGSKTLGKALSDILPTTSLLSLEIFTKYSLRRDVVFEQNLISNPSSYYVPPPFLETNDDFVPTTVGTILYTPATPDLNT